MFIKPSSPSCQDGHIYAAAIALVGELRAGGAVALEAAFVHQFGLAMEFRGVFGAAVVLDQDSLVLCDVFDGEDCELVGLNLGVPG